VVYGVCVCGVWCVYVCGVCGVCCLVCVWCGVFMFVFEVCVYVIPG